MNSSPGRHRGETTADPIMLKKACRVSPLLQKILPKATLQLASPLSNDDEEVLIYLIEYGDHLIRATGAPSPARKSPWKPWKSASVASSREQVFSPFSSSASCRESPGLGEEVSSKTSSWVLGNHKASSTCDCFSCYSSFWSRWNVSPNRDIINEILDVIEDVIEEGPRSGKGKKKKRADKKRVQMASASGLNREGLINIWTPEKTSRASGAVDKACVPMTSTTDSVSYANITTNEVPKNVSETVRTGCRKAMFRVTKQKDKACVATPKFGALRVNNACTGLDDGVSVVSGLVGDGANGVEAAATTEEFGNLLTEASEVVAAGISPAFLSTKNSPKLSRVAKRRHNQVTPLDCESLSDVEREQEAAITVENVQVPMSPRAADIGLAGRGFLARVFPDALGRVASRLWDLVSVRLRSRAVEYH